MASINQHRRIPRPSRIGTNKYGTGQTNGAYCCEFLSSLSLYNMNKWGTDLVLRYGHNRHVRKHRDGRQLPSYYIPPLVWWQHHAYCIRILAYGNNRSTTALRRLDPFPAIVEAMNHHMSQGNNAYSFGYEVDQHIPSTPGHARAILYCAIAIELVSYGLDQYSTPMALHLRDMAQHCLDVATPHFTSSRGMNSNNFANTAIQSAERAIKYFTRILSEHESKITRQFEEEREKQQFVKTQALNAIRGWLRNILFRRSIQLRLRRRNALSSFCRGTSSYAKQLQIQKHATNPPVPTSSDPPTSSSVPSTSKADSHPFRHRALPLPPRNKKRRRGRKHRNRPPPKYRRENPITSSPSSHNLTPYTDAIQPAQPTASGRSFVRRTIVPRTDRISHKRRKTTKSNPTSFMPLCFWAL